ncbi:hypothetical protein DRH13_05330 [Candidatus Woesebacteria bacterium]|nr:MAG: hypothetical protein DRH13_05330 [Candidatus Woesebacteria bacterium]
MSGPEREKPQFAPEEEELIDYYAAILAEQGEEAIIDLRIERYGLMKNKFALLKADPNKIVFQVAQTLGHNIELVNEVINRADENMRKAGTDSESRMRKLIVREKFGRFNDQAPKEESK